MGLQTAHCGQGPDRWRLKWGHLKLMAQDGCQELWRLGFCPTWRTNKLACQLQRCWQKTPNSWVTEQREFITHSDSSSHGNITAPVPWALILAGWHAEGQVLSDYTVGWVSESNTEIRMLWSYTDPQTLRLAGVLIFIISEGKPIYPYLREAVSIFQGCLLCKTSQKRQSREN